VIWMSVLAVGAAAWAQTPVEPARSAETEKSGEAEGSTDRRQAEGASADSTTRRLREQLARLQREMPGRLDLDAEQREAVDDLFDEYLSELKANPHDTGGASDKDSTKEIAELRRKLQEARESKDRDAMREATRQMREALEKRRTNSLIASREFFTKVEEELDEEQVPIFRGMIKEFGLESGHAETVQEIMRALHHPDVALTPEQRKMVSEKMRGALMAMSPDEKDAADMSEAARKMKEDIWKELTPAQRQKAEAVLKSSAKGEGGAERPQSTKPVDGDSAAPKDD